jgi:hypothetical protein
VTTEQLQPMRGGIAGGPLVAESPAALSGPFSEVRWIRTAVIALCGVLVGCGGSELGAEVSGVVTLDAQPIGPGVVVFAPKGGKENPAIGAIQADGSYYLKTSQDRGLRPDMYQVALQINEIPTDLAPGQRDMRPAKSRIPEKYSGVETSGLEYDVRPGANTIDIEITSQ